ncbi:hypothetical protein MP228_007547 [Amoeboaphelidium protococcarum]|nr:hypothetical protein MP228_007547 [Amoeboaphelidium protococcarum]
MTSETPNQEEHEVSTATQILTHSPTSFESELMEYDPQQSWARPLMPQFDPSKDSLVFQQTEVDEDSQVPLKNMKIPGHGTNSGILDAAPTMKMFGCTMDGNSVLCHVHGFFPYFYVPAPPNFNPSHLMEFTRSLNQNVEGAGGQAVLLVELMKKKTIYGYYGQEDSTFLKITVSSPKLISKARGILESGAFHFPGFPHAVTLPGFESNIAYELRFMIDCKIVGANWIELPAGKWCVRTGKDHTSHAQIEVDVFYEDLISHAPEGEWSKVAPLRILSFDIECAGRKGVFPDPQHDSVIQIANMVTIQGQSKPLIRNIFTLKECGHIVGSHILSYEDEALLLQKWSDFIKEVDPDIVTGYNINNFDMPYLVDRAKALKCKDSFFNLGRIRGKLSQIKDTRFSSKAYGNREGREVALEGRVILDMIQIIQRDHKLRSYSLNSVSAHFLGEQKEDVPHSIITDLQNGDAQTRRRLAVYCLKDAYLPQRLLDKLMVVINYMEMARVTGVPLNYLLSRGQQIKVVSQLYRKAKEENLVIPAMKSEGSDEQYEGATVIEPKRAFYKDPIATLDFSSLYPSIMMAHNLCYSTLVMNNQVIDALKLVKDQDYIVTPSGDKFVKSTVRKGILPTILEDLIGARKRAKGDLKKETDPFKRAVLDGRQLALKISANSVYGFTGATVGKLPCLQVSQSVTAYGREMIDFTKDLVEKQFCKANGYKHDADVVYGDTDSVMVKFGTEDLKEAMDLGREAAEFITQRFVKPIKLEFEKVYWPYLLINKKRYAGLYWTSVEKPDKMDTKGLETVRRDNCKLVSTVVDTCLKMILMEKDVEKAVNYVKGTISELLQNKVDLSLLVITKQLSKSGEDYAGKQAHVELAERMRKRDAGSAPALGDRVAYVIIKAAKGSAAYERAEDPIYVLENNIPIDTKYYLDNQLKNPLMRIFEPILPNAESQLFSGEHTRSIQVTSSSAGGLMKFTVKKMTCLGCKAVLKDQNAAVCQHCLPKINQLYMKQLDNVNELENRFSRLWTQCQRCQGSLHQDVLCTSKDCPIFYMRKRVQKDASESYNVLARFGDGFSNWSEAMGVRDAVAPQSKDSLDW